MNPKQAMANRTARLLAEGAHKPRVAYTSTPEKAAAHKAASEKALISKAERLACSDDFCHICNRCTDHFAEHTDAQILAWAKRPGMLQSLLEG